MERNARCFEDSSLNLEVLAESIKFNVASWMSVIPHFHGFFFGPDYGKLEGGSFFLVRIFLYLSC